MRTSVILAAFATTLALNTALAADMDDNLVIEAPEVLVSGDRTGPYVAARLAAAFGDDTQFDLDIVDTFVINEYESVSVNGALAIGYRFTDMFAAELEIGTGEQDIEAHTLTALGARLDSENAFGTTKLTYGLINITGEYETGMAVRPYLSAGIGLASAEFENHGVTLAGPVGPLPAGDVTVMNDKDRGIAYQIGAGIVVDITDKIGFEAGYRYFSVDDIELTAVDNVVSDIKINQHQALFGVRYSF